MSDPDAHPRTDAAERPVKQGIDELADQQLVETNIEESRIIATDLAGYQFEADTRGWAEIDTADAPEIALRVDDTIAGQTSELRLSPESVSFTVLDGPGTDEIHAQFDKTVQRMGPEFHLPSGVSTALPDGAYRFRAEGPLLGFIQFDSPCSIQWEPETEHLVLSFPHPTTVSLGFRSDADLPRGTITIPPTPDGVATALSYLSAGLRTMNPERSFPTMRSHPPAIELGDETHVPTDVREQAHETGIEIIVPPTFDALLPVAPLAYFLGANVRTADVSPVLRIPDLDVEYQLAEPPDFQYQAGKLFRRVFFLDCLVRNAGDWGTNIQELDALEASTVDLDIEDCYAKSSAERLRTYLDLDLAALDEILPPWRHWLYVDPTDSTEVLPSLPTMLSDLSLIFTPAARDTDELAAVTGTANRTWKSVVGTLGTNTDPDPHEYSASRAGYRNRLAHVAQTGDGTTVTVITTDPDAEHTSEWLEAHYRHRLGTEGTVIRRTITDQTQLAEVFATPTDLLHIVGECTADGLVCSDGTLAPETLSANNARLFILDQPGDADLTTASRVAERLVEAGSVSGLIVADETTPTTRPPASLEPGQDVRDVTATPPFVAGGLLLFGTSTQQTCQTIRYLSESAQLTAVGDGAFRMHSSGIPVFLLELCANTDAGFQAICHQLFVSPGSVSALVDHQPKLCGALVDPILDARWIETNPLGQDVMMYDGELYWPEETKRLFYPLA